MATEGKIPTYDYLKINPTDLQKFDRDDAVTLLATKRTGGAMNKATKKAPKKQKKH